MTTVKDKLQEFRNEADKLIKLIDEDEAGLMTWWTFFGNRINKLHALIHEAKGIDKDANKE